MKRPRSYKNSRLEAAIEMLMRSRAELDAQLRQSNRQKVELRPDKNEQFIHLEKTFARIDQRLSRIEALLDRIEALLKRLPDAIVERIGIKTNSMRPPL